MDAIDTLRGGQRHELDGESGDDRVTAVEGDGPDRGAVSVPGAWGCAHGTPVAGGADVTGDPTGVVADE